MPLFPWDVVFQVLTMVLQETLDLHDDEVGGTERRIGYLMREEMALAALLAQRGERERSEEAKLERSRWLADHRAERTFPCGIVPDPQPGAESSGGTVVLPVPDAPPDDESQPVWAAPLPSEPGWGLPEGDVVPPPASEFPDADLRPMQVLAAVLPADVVFIREYGDDEEVEEVGRLPRRGIQEVDVVDSSGAHVPEPIEETLEQPRLAWTVLRWTNQGAPDEDRFAFRSAWMAWKAARHLLAAKQG